MIAEFYKVLLTLYYISHLSCQRQLTTKWKLGLTPNLNEEFSSYRSTLTCDQAFIFLVGGGGRAKKNVGFCEELI
jgi:hypothetical protein